MEITYFGRSAFRMRGKDATVLTDPFTVDASKVPADIVTMSRTDRSGRFPVDDANEQRLIDGPGEYEVADVLIHGVATASEPEVGPSNTAYVFRLEDLVVCHLGKVNSKLTDEQVEEIGSIDVLLIPVGGDGALGPADASQVVAQLEPGVVVPMEYRIDDDTSELATVDQFCREMGTKEFVPQPKLSVAKSSVPSEVRVVVLEHRRG